MASIPLAKGYTPKKLSFPVYLSEKFDGVPVVIRVTVNDNLVPRYTIESRQGKSVPACATIVWDFMMLNEVKIISMVGVHTFVGELVQTANPRAPFKDTGGIARKQSDQELLLSLKLFDYHWTGGSTKFNGRRKELAKFTWSENVSPVDNYIAVSEYEVDSMMAQFSKDNPDAEGMVARSWDDEFTPGKRSWGYQKLLNEPTIDLRIVGFEEAIDKHGEPKGMVGRIIASYNGDKIGIGPGKLRHDDRVELWNKYKDAHMCSHVQEALEPLWRIAEIKYKADESYDALRQPTFQRWRDDKDEPDA